MAERMFVMLMLIHNKSCCIKEILDDLQSASVQILKKHQVIKSDNYWPRFNPVIKPMGYHIQY